MSAIESSLLRPWQISFQFLHLLFLHNSNLQDTWLGLNLSWSELNVYKLAAYKSSCIPVMSLQPFTWHAWYHFAGVTNMRTAIQILTPRGFYLDCKTFLAQVLIGQLSGVAWVLWLLHLVQSCACCGADGKKKNVKRVTHTEIWLALSKEEWVLKTEGLKMNGHTIMHAFVL